MDENQSRKLRTEILELKKSLNELNIQKERWFSKKENLKKDISKLIGKIKLIKSSEDKSNELIKKLKEDRDNYNKQVQESIKKFQNLNKEKEKVLKEKKITFNPSAIIKKIEELEFKIETEGITFEKEKSVMRQINQFKKQLADAGDVQGLFRQLKELSDEITSTKQKAEEAHKQLRSSSSKTMGYNQFLELTKKINELKKEQEQAFNNFIESKEKFAKVNEQLKEKLGSARELGEEIVLRGKRDTDKILREKTRQVEEKLKNKKKLTTEDLMIFQGTNNNKK